ncbi:Phosphoribosylamine--glycine ligase, chloroplastic [Trebouxia sp. C0009 RCD-2024]
MSAFCAELHCRSTWFREPNRQHRSGFSIRKQLLQSHRCATESCAAKRRKLCAVADSSSKLNVLVVGGGGREHALAWKLASSERCSTLFCSPGNAGIATEEGVEVKPDLNISDHQQVQDWCHQNKIGLVAVGPEQPLVDGLADALEKAGIRVFGPSARAAQLEGSKRFMKDLCKKYDIPTARYEVFSDPEKAKAYIREQGGPMVVKADGLAAGKGVIVAASTEAACSAVDDMLVSKAFGSAGSNIVVEEFLDGEEASFFALLDGHTCLALASAQDHKAVGEGDTGPNTGGMGAYSPAPAVTPLIQEQVMQEIVQRTADALVAEGCPYRGVLFAGLMIKDGKAKLLEHNVRFGDPECQNLMLRLESDLLEVLLAACDGTLAQVQLRWSPHAALTVVMAAKGYPGSYKKGSIIRGLDRVSTAKVFHAGTARDTAGNIVAAGGRVLGISATGKTVLEAQQKAYEAVDAIDWPEGFVRRDIGWRAMDRTS